MHDDRYAHLPSDLRVTAAISWRENNCTPIMDVANVLLVLKERYGAVVKGIWLNPFEVDCLIGHREMREREAHLLCDLKVPETATVSGVFAILQICLDVQVAVHTQSLKGFVEFFGPNPRPLAVINVG